LKAYWLAIFFPNEVETEMGGINCSLKVAYSVGEAMEMLSIGRTTLYYLVKSGRLISCKIGRRTVFRASDILAFLDSLDGGRASR
jgi:excisionase family DNA binding protein